MGPTSRLAHASPSQIAENSIVSASMTNTVAKPSSRLCLWASKRPHMLETSGGVLGNLGRQRVDPPRRVKELPAWAGDRANADENIADAQEAAQRLAVQRVLEIGRLRPGDQLLVRAVSDHDRSSVALHQRGGGEPQRFRA